MQHSTGMRAARCAAPGPSSSALAARLACHASTSSRALAHVAPSVASVREASASQANSALVAPTATSHTSCRPAVHGEASSAPSSAARIENPYTALALVTAAATALALLLPPAGHCSESLSESSFAAFQSFLVSGGHQGVAYVSTCRPGYAAAHADSRDVPAFRTMSRRLDRQVRSCSSSPSCCLRWYVVPVQWLVPCRVAEFVACAVFLTRPCVDAQVPLFPTQPLSIASGLLFGPVTVRAALHLGGTVLVCLRPSAIEHLMPQRCLLFL